MRTSLAIIALLALSTGAQAYCYRVPDDASSAYVENGLQHNLCLQGELEGSTNDKAAKSQLDAAIGKLQRDIQRQKFQLQQLQTLDLPRHNRLLLP